MKKLAVIFTLLAVIGLGDHVIAQEPEKPVISPEFTLTEKIDNIDVPYRILLDAQMEFPAHVVTSVNKTQRNGSEVYRLRVDDSDPKRGGMSIHLIYDMQWRLLGDEKSLVPLPSAPPDVSAEVQLPSSDPDEAPTEQIEEEEEPEEAPEEEPEEAEEQQVEDRPRPRRPRDN